MQVPRLTVELSLLSAQVLGMQQRTTHAAIASSKSAGARRGVLPRPRSLSMVLLVFPQPVMRLRRVGAIPWLVPLQPLLVVQSACGQPQRPCPTCTIARRRSHDSCKSYNERRVSMNIYNEERKRQRLLDRAKGLSDDDLLMILSTRASAKAKAQAKATGSARAKATAKANATRARDGGGGDSRGSGGNGGGDATL